MTQIQFADLSTITYTYDAGNRVTQIMDSVSGTITRGFDGLNRLILETTPQGSVSYTYDNAGRRATMTVAGQAAVNYTFDNGNRLTQIAQGTATVTIGYDNANRRTSLTLPNGIVASYGYDTASRLTGITYTQGQTTVGNLAYGYDANGRRTSTGGSLARVNLPAALTSATYNANNELTNWAGTTMSYDANGNMTSDGATMYTWDARGRLAAFGSIGFAYDSFGRRTQNAATMAFLYDGVNPVQELSGSTVTANLLTGLGIDKIFTRTDSIGVRNFLTDAAGSPVALTDSSGTTQTQYNYEPFGKTTASGSTSNNTYQYTGRENDGTGLYYYRARYYNPTLQRFISEDPLGSDTADTTLFKYAGNDPIDFIDPLGLDKSNQDNRPSCFVYFLKEWGTAMSPYPTDIGLTDAIEPTAKGLSLYSWNKAMNYAVSRGLGAGATGPWSSSIFRRLVNTSKFFEEAAWPALLVGTEVPAFISEMKEMREGNCQ